MSTQSEVEAFFASGPPRDPERVNGRYKFVDPFGKEVSATSASNYGFPLADQYALNKWRLRRLVAGIASRLDLAQMVSVLDPEDIGKIDEVIETAMAVAKTSEKANRGTAIHEALRLADEGKAYPEWAEPYVQAYRAELQRFGLRVGLIEADVYSPGLGARGRLDRTFIEADGGHVLGDIKSTGHLEEQAHEISVQLKVYQAATHYRDTQGAWHPIPRGKSPLRDDYAIVVHVDQEHATVTLYRVDLWIGARGAVLAEQVRQWRKTKPVLLPYAPPATPAPAPATRPEPPTIGAMVQEEIDAIGHPLAAGEIERAGEPAPTPDGELFVAEADIPPLRKATDLLRQSVTKAQCQEYARQHGIKDLAHTKKVLVEMLRKIGRLLPEDAQPAQVAAEEHPTRTQAFKDMTLSKISNAADVGELELIRQAVVKQGGEAAWLSAYVQAAKAKVAELPNGGVAGDVLTEINQCQNSEDLGKLWEKVTNGGHVPGNWTDATQAAALRRLEEINSATPPAVSNPFGGS